MGLNFFSPGDSHTKGMLFVLHLGLEGITEVNTDPEGRSVSFKVTTSNDSSLFVPLRSIAPENSWLGSTFLKDYKIICKKNEGNENKIILRDLNCTMDKIDRDSENKTQRLYRCCSNYALSKIIVDNGLEDLGEGRTQIPLSSPTTIGSLPRIHDRLDLYWYKNC